MLALMITLSLLFTWLLHETQWLRVRLPQYTSVTECHSCAIPYAHWLKEFAFYSPHNVRCFIPRPDYSSPKVYSGYVITRNGERSWGQYTILLSYGVADVLCGTAWLDKHWNDLKDYRPKVELNLGNGYKQTFILNKPELIGKIIKINTGRKYLRQLARG